MDYIKLHVKYFYQLIENKNSLSLREIWFEYNYRNGQWTTPRGDVDSYWWLMCNCMRGKHKHKPHILTLSPGLPLYKWWFETGLYKFIKPFRIVGSFITKKIIVLFSDYEYQYLVR